MVKKMTRKSLYFGVFILFLSVMFSCEKDFQDIGTSVINNTKFNTKDTIIEIEITNKAITNVRGDGLAIGGSLGQYLLGVYNNLNYEKIEASIVSQIVIGPDLKVLDRDYSADTTVITTIDTVYLRLPYQATLQPATSAAVDFKIDSVIGDPTKAFTLNIYQSDTYLNKLNPADPSKSNTYPSDAIYQKLPGELNAQVNYQFKPNPNDTVFFIKRRLSNGALYATDTVALTNKSPFARIPLNESRIKQLFLDKYETSDFASQEAFNQYFKGLYIEASGNEGSLTAFDIRTTLVELKPSLEIHYTNTVFKGSTVVDTIKKSNSFFLSSFSNSIYKMPNKIYPTNKNVIVQGTAGNMGEVKLFGADNNTNGIADQIEELRNKNWLINDASLIFYVNQDIVQFDTIATPFKLFLYKNPSKPSHVKDLLSEGDFIFGGKLELSSDKKPNKYTFRITDYVSDLLNNKSDYNPILGLRAYNSTDIPDSVLDTVVRTYNWNPKAVTLLNHLTSNGTRRAQLKISYSTKK